jgi:hypothetical protein
MPIVVQDKASAESAALALKEDLGTHLSTSLDVDFFYNSYYNRNCC